MSPVAKSAFAFSLYLFAVGFAFMLAPHAAVAPLGLTADDIWTRACGIVVTTLAFYYFTAARHELTAFFRASVLGRFFVLIAITTLAFALHAPMAWIAFGLIDAAFGAWTLVALRGAPHV